MRWASSDDRSYAFSIFMAATLLCGFAFAWSHGYWAIALALGGVLLAGIFWVIAEQKIHPLPAFVPVVLIAVWGAAQTFSGRTVAQWVTTQSSLTWIAAGVSFFVASQVLRSSRNREVFLSILLWGSAVLSVFAIVQAFTIPSTSVTPFAVGTFVYKNQFAAMLELAAPIALYRAVSSTSTRYLGAGLFTVFFAAGIASLSRAGAALLLAELVFALVFAVRTQRLNWMGATAAVGVLALMLTGGAMVVGPKALMERFQEKDQYGIRRDLLHTTLRIAADRPLFGFGMGTFSIVYPQYAEFDVGAFINAAHCDWAEWAVEGGYPFAICIAALVLMVSAAAIRSLWGIGVLAVALQSLVDYPTREPALALCWFALMGALTCPTRRSGSQRRGPKPAPVRLRRDRDEAGITGNTANIDE